MGTMKVGGKYCDGKFYFIHRNTKQRHQDRLNRKWHYVFIKLMKDCNFKDNVQNSDCLRSDVVQMNLNGCFRSLSPSVIFKASVTQWDSIKLLVALISQEINGVPIEYQLALKRVIMEPWPLNVSLTIGCHSDSQPCGCSLLYTFLPLPTVS